MAGVLLAGCGTQSPSTATKSWMQTSNFTVNAQQLRHDAEAAARGLRSVATTTKELHTVCAVLSVDTLAANAALPTPDSQLTADLAGAYNDLGGGAQVCYRAGSSQPQRQRAINLLVRGVGSLLASALRASVVTSG
jgi:hypothetical protein